MKSFVKKHKHKILAGHGIVIVFFLLSSLLTMERKEAVFFFTPYGEEVLPLGHVDDVDVNVSTSIPINALGATIVFPEEMIEVVTMSKKKSFLDLWTEETTLKEASGEMLFSGGTLKSGGLTGTGTAVTLSIRAKKSGKATLSFKDTQIIASDGKGTVLPHETRSITYVIPEERAVSVPVVLEVTPTPSHDLDGSGAVTIADASILLVQFLRPYDPRYDLDVNGSVGLSDLSILFAGFR